jgi:hypothetical protein
LYHAKAEGCQFPINGINNTHRKELFMNQRKLFTDTVKTSFLLADDNLKNNDIPANIMKLHGARNIYIIISTAKTYNT